MIEIWVNAAPPNAVVSDALIQILSDCHQFDRFQLFKCLHG